LHTLNFRFSAIWPTPDRLDDDMIRRMTLAALLAALTVPAHAGQDALQTLYEQAGLRAEAKASTNGDTKAGARSKFGDYAPRSTVMSGQVRSVLHVHRAPDGRLVTECRTEYPGREPEHDHGIRPPREQR
jgi:hypothetical protein